MMNPPCCAVFSLFGVVFLVSIGLLLQREPLYIKGVEDADVAAKGCYQGALIYTVTLVLSLLIIGFRKATNKDTVPASATNGSSKSQYGAVGNDNNFENN